MDKISKFSKKLQNLILQKILDNIPKNLKLEQKEINGTIIYKSPDVEAEKYNISRCLFFDRYNDVIIEFTKSLEDNFSHCNLSSFYHNMETLEIKDKVEDLITISIKKLCKNIYGFYRIPENKIQLLKDYKNTLKHELLHLSTGKFIGNIQFSGFYQYNEKINSKIGVYLNEGYTEHLNQKYFIKTEINTYKLAKNFAMAIERILGAKKMQELYFDSDLYGLIEELEKYCIKEAIFNLINKIDYYCEQYYMHGYNNNKIYEEILSMIANIYRTKLSIDLSEKKIDEEEYKKKKLLYCDDLENGRINSDNIEVEEYQEYYLIIDKKSHESHFYMKNPLEYKTNDLKITKK